MHDDRGRPPRRDFISEMTRQPRPAVRRPVKEAAAPVASKPKRGKKKLWLLVPTALLLVVAGTASAIYLRQRSSSPVPPAVARTVDFPVYYPDSDMLPPGYRLDKDSFSTPVKNGVAYSVSYGGGKKIVFSVQPKPSDGEIQTFNSSYIPLRTAYQTSVGQAEIGAYRLQTLVSLPVIDGPWIVITAPPDIDQGQLKTVLRSVKH